MSIKSIVFNLFKTTLQKALNHITLYSTVEIMPGIDVPCVIPEKKQILSYVSTPIFSKEQIGTVIDLAEDLLYHTLPKKLKIKVACHVVRKNIQEDGSIAGGGYQPLDYKVNEYLISRIILNDSPDFIENEGGAALLETLFHEYRHFYQACMFVDGSQKELHRVCFDADVKKAMIDILQGRKTSFNSNFREYFFNPVEIDAVAYSRHILYCLYGVQAPYPFNDAEYIRTICKRQKELAKRYPKAKVRKIASKYNLPDLCGFKQIKY